MHVFVRVCDRADRVAAFDPDEPQHIYIHPAQQGNDKSFRGGKPRLWLMLCMVCKGRNICKVMATGGSASEMVPLILCVLSIILF